jgi:hypothetical protein
MKRWGIIFAAALLAACAGKDGAQGPTGPQGPQGIAGVQGLPGPAGTNGSANKITVTGVATVSSSGVIGTAVALPSSVGADPTHPPEMSCYTTNVASSGAWLAVAGTPSTTGPYCGLVFGNGTWNAVMNQMALGWTAAFVVVY